MGIQLFKSSFELLAERKDKYALSTRAERKVKNFS